VSTYRRLSIGVRRACAGYKAGRGKGPARKTCRLFLGLADINDWQLSGVAPTARALGSVFRVQEESLPELFE
jgi:hypothetical protein